MYDTRRSTALPAFFFVIVLIIVAGVAFQLLRSLPALQAETLLAATTPLGEETSLVLPEQGATIVSVEGIGVVGSADERSPRPIASVTKVMTAYVILRDHPMVLGESGPQIDTSQNDEDRYFEMIGQDQSALAVAAGLQLSQLELLQGLLVPSANNFAETLAAWDSGSVDAFVEKMNLAASSLGMLDTRYTDVSGFSPETVSTPADQLTLSLAALGDPVFAAIVASPSVELSNIGSVASTNELLGSGGIFGIKTGYADEAAGNLAFAARRPVGDQQVEIVGGVFS